MPDTHAKLSASSADRWIHCPGSIKLSEQAPPKGDTVYTMEGTDAHILADLRVHSIVLGEKLKRKETAFIKGSAYYTEEMSDAANVYANYIQELFQTAGKGAELMTEQRLDMTRWIPDGFGTADCCILGDDTLYVCDFKYGKGVPVSAEGNTQIRLYGLGAIDLFDGLYDFSKVSLNIIQPRLGSISREELSVQDLLKWGDGVVRTQAEKAMAGSDEFAAGDWCRFCPCSPICREQAKVRTEIAKYDFADESLMTPAEITEVLKIADPCIKWLNAVKEYALARALAGETFDGWKVVEGRSTRQYADELLVKQALNAAGFDDALIYERKMYGITAMTKIVGKKEMTELEQMGLILKPEGKPVLVPETDKRDALDIDRIKKAQTDFAEFDEF